jgi:pimeloyl-ACP methyl ester carboxylesterase
LSTEIGWEEAWDRASRTLEGVTRRRVRGSSPDVEIALLDWGGEGDLVLLHHANGFCGAMLAPVAKVLSARYRVVAVDARGHGDSTSVAPGGEPDPYAWSALAADLHAAMLEILGIVGRDRVEIAIGHSFGGALMLASAQREPARFGKLLLCDPVILPDPAEGAPPARGPDLAAGARKRRAEFSSRAEAYAHFRTRRLFADFTPEALALYVGEGMVETADGRFALKCRPEVEAAIFSAAAWAGLYADVEQISAEVLFLHALRGNFLHERYQRLAGRIKHASVESLDVGHLFPMEEPEQVLGRIDGWGTRSD